MTDTVLIFVVEDEPLIQQALELALIDAGYAVETALTAVDALAKLDAQGRIFRALVTDINLEPGPTTGWDVARHARELNASIPVVYMTGSESNDWPSLGVPGSILVVKPFAEAQIVMAVSQLLNKAAQIVN